jgi:hypothetical protein
VNPEEIPAEIVLSIVDFLVERSRQPDIAPENHQDECDVARRPPKPTIC